MILISRLSNGALLIQRDSAEILIDAPAIPASLPLIIRELIDQAHAIADARKDAFENGLAIGRERGMIEAETHYRMEEARLLEMDEQLALKVVRVHMSA